MSDVADKLRAAHKAIVDARSEAFGKWDNPLFNSHLQGIYDLLSAALAALPDPDAVGGVHLKGQGIADLQPRIGCQHKGHDRTIRRRPRQAGEAMRSTKLRERIERAARRMKVRILKMDPMMDDVAIALNSEPTFEEIKIAGVWAEAFGLDDAALAKLEKP